MANKSIKQIRASFFDMMSVEKKMSNLNNKLKNRKLNVSFKNSKGSLVDSMIESANQLNEVKNALRKLTSDAERIIKNARESFEYTDKNLSKHFKG